MALAKFKPLTLVAKVSNFIELCQENGITKEHFDEMIESGVISLPNVSINLTERKTFRGWDQIEIQLKDILRQKIKITPEVDSLLAVLLHLEDLISAISAKIVCNVKERYDERTFFDWFLGGELKEAIHYYEAVQTNDLERGLAEYLEINIKGSIACTQRKMESDDVILNVTINFRAVTLLLNIAASILNYRFTGPELLQKLKWYTSNVRYLK